MRIAVAGLWRMERHVKLSTLVRLLIELFYRYRSVPVPLKPKRWLISPSLPTTESARFRDFHPVIAQILYHRGYTDAESAGHRREGGMTRPQAAASALRDVEDSGAFSSRLVKYVEQRSTSGERLEAAPVAADAGPRTG